MKEIVLSTCFVILLLAGCDSKSVDKKQIVETGDQVASNIVVRVGNESLTTEDLAVYGELLASRLSKTLSKTPERLAKQKEKLVKMRVRAFAGSRLLYREGCRRGLKFDQEKYDRQMVRYAKLPMAQKRMAESILAEDLIIAALRHQIRAEVGDVDEQKIVRCLKAIDVQNERAAATNAASLVFLSELKRRIDSGKISFEEAAQKESEDDWIHEMGCEWGSFSPEELEGEDELLAALKRLKVGEVTDPLAVDSGYALVRFDALKDGKYVLSRIYRRRMAMLEKESADQLRERIRKETAEKRLNDLVSNLLRATPPVYPNGTNFNNKVKESK